MNCCGCFPERSKTLSDLVLFQRHEAKGHDDCRAASQSGHSDPGRATIRPRRVFHPDCQKSPLSLAAQGKAILYSSHVLEIVEKICSRVLVIYKGDLVADDSIENLRSLMQLPSLEEIFIQLVQQENTEQIAKQMIEVIQN